MVTMTELTVWLCLSGMLPFEEVTHQHGYATYPPRLSLITEQTYHF